MDQIIYYIGQGLGIVAIILGFVTYQMKTREQLLFIQIATTICFSIHYLMIGAYSGLALNCVGTVRNIAYYYVGQKGSVDRRWAIAFSLIMGTIGILSWQDWYSVFVVLGLVINSFCMSFAKPQNIRKSIFVTSPLVLIYDVFVLSVGGIVYESVAIISAFVGTLRNRMAPKEKTEETVG